MHSHSKDVAETSGTGQHLSSRSNFTPDHICALLDLCLTTTYFQYSEGFYRQKHGCAMGSPVSPKVTNLYMEVAYLHRNCSKQLNNTVEITLYYNVVSVQLV